MFKYNIVNIFVLSLILISVLSSAAVEDIESPYRSWVYQLQNASPDELSKLNVDVVVIDYSYNGSESGRYSKEQIKRIKKNGSIVLAYINIGQAEDYRFYWRKSWNESPPDWIISEDPEWGENYYIKYWKQSWKEIIFSYIDKIFEEGFDGVYLDRIDAFEYVANIGILSEKRAAERMIDFIIKISNYIKNKKGNSIIVLQNGEEILKYDDGKLLEKIDGWAVESLFYSYECQKLNPEGFIEEREKYLRIAQNNGKFILDVEYIDDGKDSEETKNRIRELINLCRIKRYIPYVYFCNRKLEKINYRFFQIYSSLELKNN